MSYLHILRPTVGIAYILGALEIRSGTSAESSWANLRTPPDSMHSWAYEAGLPSLAAAYVGTSLMLFHALGISPVTRESTGCPCLGGSSQSPRLYRAASSSTSCLVIRRTT